jgi:hypothetical protein
MKIVSNIVTPPPHTEYYVEFSPAEWEQWEKLACRILGARTLELDRRIPPHFFCAVKMADYADGNRDTGEMITIKIRPPPEPDKGGGA